MSLNLPKNFFSPLIKEAVATINPEKIILFGSFARGDQKEKSDIDLAFDFSPSPNNWIIFKNWVEDDFSTLRKLDLVNLKEADASLRTSILNEGVIIYERKD